MTAKCSDPNAWRTQPPTEVNFPYRGEDSAVRRVPTFEPSVSRLRESFDIPDGAFVPAGSIGWDTPAERSYRSVLVLKAEELRTYGNPALGANSKARRQIQELGEAAYQILAGRETGQYGIGYTSIPDLYEHDMRRWGSMLEPGRKFPLSEEPQNLPTRIFIGRTNLRHAIIDAYAAAAQLLWCASLGQAEVESYWENRQAYEAAIRPKDPTQLASPEWANYKPIDYDDPRINRESDVEVTDVLDVDWADPQTVGEATPSPAQQGGGGAGIAIAAGIGIAALFFLTRGRR